jgi:hypothetical protein
VIDYAEVLVRRHRGRNWSINANDYNQLVMLDGADKPSKASLDDAWPDVQLEISQERADKLSAREALLVRLGVTADEAKFLLGL